MRSICFLISGLFIVENSAFRHLIRCRKGTCTNRFAIEEVGNENEQPIELGSDYDLRFKNVARLYGTAEALDRLRSAHVAVIGLGGVGSWVVEALARSGINKFTLIDMDDICVSNVNRQIQALTSTVGQFKGDALKARILDINPSAEVCVRLDFIRPTNVEELVREGYSYIVDAADGVSDKASIVHACVQSGTPIVVSGGVGGLVDPTLIRITDMARVIGDSLVMQVRKKLRQKYGYPLGLEVKNGKKVDKKWGVSCVHTLPTGTRRGLPEQGQEGGSLRKCDMTFGNACFSTGTVGLAMASVVCNEIATGKVTIPALPALRAVGDAKRLSESPASTATSSEEESLAAFIARVSSIASSSGVQSSAAEGEQEAPQASMMMDNHCHLQLSPLFETANEAVSLSQSKGVVMATVCGTAPGDDWRRIVDLHERQPSFVRPSFGLHPWWIRRYLESLGVVCGGESEDAVLATTEIPTGWEEELEELLLRIPNSGVGECGLDKAIKRDVSLQLQEYLLQRHCVLAQRHRRPLTVHCVGAWARLQIVLAAYTEVPIVLHSASSCPLDIARHFIAQPNIFFSFTAKNLQPRVKSLMRMVPSARFMVETDSPDQLLTSLRDSHEFNSPANLPASISEIAAALEVDNAALAALAYQNSKRVFDF